MLSVYEIKKKKKTETKSYYKDKMGKNKKQMQTGHNVKAGTGSGMNRAQDGEQC